MEAAPAAALADLNHHLGLARTIASAARTQGVTAKKERIFLHWTSWCNEQGVPCTLNAVLHANRLDCLMPTGPVTASADVGGPPPANPAKTLSSMAACLQPSAPWPRASPDWTARIPESTSTLAKLVHSTLSSSKDARTPMGLPHGSTPSAPPSSQRWLTTLTSNTPLRAL